MDELENVNLPSINVESLDRRHDDVVIRKLELMEIQLAMLSNKVNSNYKNEHAEVEKISKLVEKLDSRLDKIESFEKQITGSWKGAAFTIVIMWAILGDKVKNFFH